MTITDESCEEEVTCIEFWRVHRPHDGVDLPPRTCTENENKFPGRLRNLQHTKWNVQKPLRRLTCNVPVHKRRLGLFGHYSCSGVINLGRRRTEQRQWLKISMQNIHVETSIGNSHSPQSSSPPQSCYSAFLLLGQPHSRSRKWQIQNPARHLVCLSSVFVHEVPALMILQGSPWNPSRWILFLHQGSSQIAANVRICILCEYNRTYTNTCIYFRCTKMVWMHYDTAWHWRIPTPNIWRRSGSRKRNGMLETWRRFGWALFEPSSSLPLPAPPPDDTDTLRDWGSEVKVAKASSWQWEYENRRRRENEHRDRWRKDKKEQTKTERWKTKDGKRKSMNEMRADEKKKRGEGISRKAKKEREKKEQKWNQFKEQIRQHLSENLFFSFSHVSITWH